jgi:dolichol-phosphate mannosyltransferase
MRKNNFKISVIVPVYNEEGCIAAINERISSVLSSSYNYELIFIDDGSSDNTLDEIKKIRPENSAIQYLSFSRNFGHQNALRAGIKHATGDCIVSLDADLQHPPELIPEMIKKWKEGFDIVYTIRKDDHRVPFAKKFMAKVFYKFMNAISEIRFERGEADFRLIDRHAAAELNNLNEHGIFFRGMVKWVGFRQTGIEYVPDERIWGKTKYSGRKMMSLAVSGITGFSIKPLRISTVIGICIAFLSILYGIYALYERLFTDNTVEGWTSVFFMVTFIGGIQLMMIGILGEYIGKIFMETKKRPHYIINENSILEDSRE